VKAPTIYRLHTKFRKGYNWIKKKPTPTTLHDLILHYYFAM